MCVQKYNNSFKYVEEFGENVEQTTIFIQYT